MENGVRWMRRWMQWQMTDVADGGRDTEKTGHGTTPQSEKVGNIQKGKDPRDVDVW